MKLHPRRPHINSIPNRASVSSFSHPCRYQRFCLPLLTGTDFIRHRAATPHAASRLTTPAGSTAHLGIAVPTVEEVLAARSTAQQRRGRLFEKETVDKREESGASYLHYLSTYSYILPWDTGLSTLHLHFYNSISFSSKHLLNSIFFFSTHPLPKCTTRWPSSPQYSSSSPPAPPLSPHHKHHKHHPPPPSTPSLPPSSPQNAPSPSGTNSSSPPLPTKQTTSRSTR